MKVKYYLLFFVSLFLFVGAVDAKLSFEQDWKTDKIREFYFMDRNNTTAIEYGDGYVVVYSQYNDDYEKTYVDIVQYDCNGEIIQENELSFSTYYFVVDTIYDGDNIYLSLNGYYEGHVDFIIIKLDDDLEDVDEYYFEESCYECNEEAAYYFSSISTQFLNSVFIYEDYLVYLVMDTDDFGYYYLFLVNKNFDESVESKPFNETNLKKYLPELYPVVQEIEKETDSYRILSYAVNDNYIAYVYEYYDLSYDVNFRIIDRNGNKLYGEGLTDDEEDAALFRLNWLGDYLVGSRIDNDFENINLVAVKTNGEEIFKFDDILMGIVNKKTNKVFAVNDLLFSNVLQFEQFSLNANIKTENGKYGYVKVDESATVGSIVEFKVLPEDLYVLDTLKITDEDGNEIAVDGNKFVMPASDVLITSTYKKDGNNPNTGDAIIIVSIVGALTLICFIVFLSEKKRLS